MNVALFVRVSTDRQDADNQLADLQGYCDRAGHKIVAIYNETVSGSKSAADRPQLRQMLADARQKKFEALHFWSLDRLSREGALETLEYLRQLTSHGIAWRSYQEAYLDSLGPLGEGIIGLIACIAKMERARITERRQASIRLRRERGLPLGRPKAIFDREKVRQASADGMSVRQLAKKFGVGAGTIHRTLAATA